MWRRGDLSESHLAEPAARRRWIFSPGGAGESRHLWPAPATFRNDIMDPLRRCEAIRGRAVMARRVRGVLTHPVGREEDHKQDQQWEHIA